MLPFVATETIHVLLIEDEPTDAEFTRAMLGQVHGAEVTLNWSQTFDDGLSELESGRYDVALVDYMLGPDNGLDLVREAVRRELPTPIILLTGKGSREVDLEAQEAGADDYLVKGQIDPAGLERALRYTLERRRTLAALQESEARFRGLFDHLPMGLFRCRADGEFLDANPALVHLLGNPDPTLLRERFASSFYVHPSDLPRFRSLLQKDGVVRGFESWIERSDGFHVPVRTTARAYHQADGRIGYVEGAVEDVRTVESIQRLRMGQARFRAAMERLPVAVVVLDPNGLVLDVAPGVDRIVGRHAAEMVTRSIAEVIDLDDAGALAPVLDDLRAGRSASARLEGTIRGGATDPRRCALVLAPVVDDEGELTELVGLLDAPTPSSAAISGP